MNRRHFAKLIGIGLFNILPGAGRVWKATKPDIQWHTFSSPHFQFMPSFQDFLKNHVDGKLRFVRFDQPNTWPENGAVIYRRPQ